MQNPTVEPFRLGGILRRPQVFLRKSRNSDPHEATAASTTAMPSQRPFFLSTFLAAFRQQTPSSLSSQQTNKQPSKQTASASSYATSASAPRTISSGGTTNQGTTRPTGVVNQLSLHSPRAGIPIPNNGAGRRRGSDSSSEGFRDVRGADKLYIGGRTAAGEERFFKLGVVRRVRSNDGLSLDRLSL